MNILMICTGNTCRSPMAEGIVRKLAEEKGWHNVTVDSAGLGAFGGEEPTAHAQTAMQEIGVDISAKRSRRAVIEDLEQADRIYVMTQSHKDILLDALPELEEKIVVLDIADPFGRELDIYRDCRDRMTAFFTEELEQGARFGQDG